jgi:hypothetical protein
MIVRLQSVVHRRPTRISQRMKRPDGGTDW